MPFTTVTGTDPLSGKAFNVLVPTIYNAGTPTGVIIYCHGNGGAENALLVDSLAYTCRDILINNGYILAGSVGNGVFNVAEPPTVDAYVGLASYIKANYNVRGFALWSMSMGGITGLRAIMDGRINYCGWLGTYPVCNIAKAYAGLFTQQINTAYGISNTATQDLATFALKIYGNDPAAQPARAFRDVPMRFYSSPGDDAVTTVDHSNVIASICASSRRECTVVQCTGYHGDTSHFQPQDYLDFFNRCFAAPVGQLEPRKAVFLPGAAGRGVVFTKGKKILPVL